MANEIHRRAGTSRRAVVTGGAAGLGQAYAIRLAQDGADIVIVDMMDASATEAEIRKTGRKVRSYQCDLTNIEALTSMTQAIIADLGGCDILVNNAGLGAAQPFAEIGYAKLRHILALNLEAPFLLCSAFLPAMRDRGWGRIINISSATVNQAVPFVVDYITSKAGIVGLTRALATEVGIDGVTVNAIAPGLVRTPLTETGRGNAAPIPQEQFEMVRQMQSVPRTMVPADLAGTVSFLASDDAAFITGQIIHVDGGTTRV